MKLKGLHFEDVTEIQETVTDELKRVQKEEFSAAFQKLRVYDHAKTCVLASGAYLELKKGMYLHASTIVCVGMCVGMYVCICIALHDTKTCLDILICCEGKCFQ